jgi:hypothetical protein
VWFQNVANVSRNIVKYLGNFGNLLRRHFVTHSKFRNQKLQKKLSITDLWYQVLRYNTVDSRNFVTNSKFRNHPNQHLQKNLLFTDLWYKVLGYNAVDGILEELPHRDDHTTEEQQKYRHLNDNY